jgi:hypothetical protein
MSPRFLLRLLFAVGGAWLPARAAAVRGEAAASWTENISRSSAPVDWRDALSLQSRATWGFQRQSPAGLLARGELSAGLLHVPRYDRLDAATAGVSGLLRKKFGFGAYAPAVALEGSLQAREARLAGDDGWTASAALNVTRRLTASWRVGATADWQEHHGASAVYDTAHHRVFGTVTWDINDRWSLSHGNGRLWGEFTANASPGVWASALAGGLGRPLAEYYATVPRLESEIFGPRWVTYRVEGRVSFWWLELAPALGRNTSLPLRYESLFSVNKAGIKYRQDTWSLQVVHRF